MTSHEVPDSSSQEQLPFEESANIAYLSDARDARDNYPDDPRARDLREALEAREAAYLQEKQERKRELLCDIGSYTLADVRLGLAQEEDERPTRAPRRKLETPRRQNYLNPDGGLFQRDRDLEDGNNIDAPLSPEQIALNEDGLELSRAGLAQAALERIMGIENEDERKKALRAYNLRQIKKNNK